MIFLSSSLICLACEGGIWLQEVERDYWHERQGADGFLASVWGIERAQLLPVAQWLSKCYSIQHSVVFEVKRSVVVPSQSQQAICFLPFMSIITLNLLEPNASFTLQANQKGRQKKIICIFGVFWPHNTRVSEDNFIFQLFFHSCLYILDLLKFVLKIWIFLRKLCINERQKHQTIFDSWSSSSVWPTAKGK